MVCVKERGGGRNKKESLVRFFLFQYEDNLNQLLYLVVFYIDKWKILYPSLRGIIVRLLRLCLLACFFMY
jgi:hypothetical protein